MPVDKLFNLTVDLLSKSIDLRARNQNYLSANIANAETPGYLPRRLSFEGELKEAMEQKPQTPPPPANPRFIPIKGGNAQLTTVQGEVLTSPTSGTIGRDGNGVELEGEMSQLAENQIMYNASIQLLVRKFDLLKSAIKGSI